MTHESRQYDLVVWGASGFTGRLVAEYLAAHPDIDDVNWAIAGRNRGRLEDVRRSLGPPWRELPILLGDAFDRSSLDEIAGQTGVICTTVGPYSRFGSELVAACVDAGTDYCDLTGEVPWIREMIDTHHDTARRRRARIVHCCGFDSIPSDLGVWLVQSESSDRYGAPCERVDCFVRHLRGGISGGTTASMAEVVGQAAADATTRKVLTDPYALNPPERRSGPDGPPQSSPRYDARLGEWTAPFMMATVNEKVVRRTNALLDGDDGNGFRYRETMCTGKGASGAARAAMVTLGLAAFSAGMALKPTRKLLCQLLLPDPGEGPDRETIEGGGFSMQLFGRCPGKQPRDFDIAVEVGADLDPGYGATAIMLAESALSLAIDEPRQGAEGGVLTPATAFGPTLIDRLRRAGMTFDVIQ